MTDASLERGGNMLGIGPAPPEGLYLVLLSASFSDAEDYGIVSDAANELLEDCTAAAKARGVYRRWVEMNHAGYKQDPIASYGAQNKAFLKDVADMYDPDAVFQRLMLGGCKLEDGCTGGFGQ